MWRRPTLRRLAGVAAFALACGAAAEARGAEGCKVRIAASASPEWVRAARELGAAKMADDCERVLIAPAGDEARITYVARDGRRAERTVAVPSELEPTVGALGVTVGEAAPVDRVAPVATEERTHLVFGIGTGGRGGDGLASGLIEARAALVQGRWHVGALIRGETGYEVEDQMEERTKAVSVIGVNVAYRSPLNRTLALVTTASTMLAFVLASDGETEDLSGEFRVGASAGLIMPRRSRTRFRVDLGIEVGVADIGRTDIVQAGLPLVPWMAGILTIGVEVGFLE